MYLNNRGQIHLYLVAFNIQHSRLAYQHVEIQTNKLTPCFLQDLWEGPVWAAPQPADDPHEPDRYALDLQTPQEQVQEGQRQDDYIQTIYIIK